MIDEIETKTITVITPTYNRAYTLKRTYNSLVEQSNNTNIEWLIVDDGSNDNTEILIKEFLSENKVSIRYIFKENGGKASALNLAFPIINTKYFTILDSDDFFHPKAIETAINELAEIESNDEIIGLYAIRNNLDGSVMGGKRIPEKVEYVKSIEMGEKFKLTTEVIVFYKTKFVKNKFLFPEYDNEKFVSPGYLNLYLSKDKRFKVSQETFCYCEYLEDGLTKNKKQIIIKNPKGYTIVKKSQYEQSSKIKSIVKNGIGYIAGSLLAKNQKIISSTSKRFWSFILFPLGYIYYLIFYKKLSNK